MALYAPAAMRCFAETWRPVTASRTGGQGITGSQQYVSNPAARWSAKASFHLLDEERAQVDVRGFLASLDGQAGTFFIGPVDWRGQPWFVDGLFGTVVTPGVAAGAINTDPAYGTNPDTSGVLDFALAEPAAMNATTLKIQRNRGGFLTRGQYLQIGERLHIITALTSVDPADSKGQAAPGVISVQVRPWLRSAYAAGTPLNFTNPQCLMRFASADQGGIEMATSPLSDLSLDLEEAF